MEPPPFLCEELLQEILLLLPVKSLVRFRCVSKSWNSTIFDSQFIKIHLHRSSSTRNTDFVHLRSLITSPQESPSATVAIPCCPFPRYNFIGTCNGLVCLHTIDYGHENQDISHFSLWNPATRSMSQPPNLPFSLICDFGFGYDSSTDTYKVVAVSFFSHTTVDVYNMGDTCWRTIPVLPHSRRYYRRGYCCERRGGVVYVSNTLNWLIKYEYNLYMIFSFDLGKENCAQLALPYYPPLIDDSHSFVPFLGVLRGSLSICQNDKNLHFVVWQMKEFGVHGSWTLLFNIPANEDIMKNIFHWRRWFAMYMYMSENGDVVMLSASHESDPTAVLYTQKDDKLERMYIAEDIVHCYGYNYIESLVSPC